jgi:hypothetical protein
MGWPCSYTRGSTREAGLCELLLRHALTPSGGVASPSKSVDVLAIDTKMSRDSDDDARALQRHGRWLSRRVGEMTSPSPPTIQRPHHCPSPFSRFDIARGNLKIYAINLQLAAPVSLCSLQLAALQRAGRRSGCTDRRGRLRASWR